MPKNELPTGGDETVVHAAVPRQHSMTGHGTNARSAAPIYLWLRAFPGEARQVGAVRQWIETLLPGCEPRETLVLAASEFGANAIEHTRSGEPGGRFTVHLAWSPAAVRITVGDQGSPLPPEAVTAALDSEHGRGLFMVDAMATNWGFTDGSEGRLLWADVPWLKQGGPQRIAPNGAMPTIEAIRRIRLACPGIKVGYDGHPAVWWCLLPGGSYPDDLIAAPCFAALTQMTTAARTAIRHQSPGMPESA